MVSYLTEPVVVITERLRLRCWTDGDRAEFARMNADPEVMHDLGGPISRAESDRKLDAYADSFERNGYSRWLIETLDVGKADDRVVGRVDDGDKGSLYDDENGSEDGGRFVGYVGVVARTDVSHPLGIHDDLGWRLTRTAWGNGYAAEAARATLADVFMRVGLSEVVAYTAPDNARSQAVMHRLNLRREEHRDFTVNDPKLGGWTGLVWSATPPST
jgi:RimJ/RimL family protein N-acetyltransferase